MRRTKASDYAAALCTGFSSVVPAGARHAMEHAAGTIWVASGLTSCAAECGRYVSARLGRRAAIRATPTSFCAEASRPLLPVLVSYKGRNHDIKSAAGHVGADPALAVCGLADAPLLAVLAEAGSPRSPVLLPKHRLDRDFVTGRATLAMAAACIVTAGAAPIPSHVCDDLAADADEHARAIDVQLDGEVGWIGHQLIILGCLSAQPALLVWERALAESSLATATVSDLKDFSHGRYLAPARQRNITFLILPDPDAPDLALRTAEHLGSITRVVRLEGRNGMLENMLFQMLVALSCVDRMAARLDIDPRRPPKPPEARRWTHWGQIPSLGKLR